MMLVALEACPGDEVIHVHHHLVSAEVTVIVGVSLRGVR